MKPSGRDSLAACSAAFASSSEFLKVTKSGIMHCWPIMGGFAPTATISVSLSNVGVIYVV